MIHTLYSYYFISYHSKPYFEKAWLW